MIYSSHRLRAQERRLAKKLVWTVVILFGSIFFAIFAGLPILAKLAVGLSYLRKEETSVSENSISPVFAPIVDPVTSATNSGSIIIKGITDKDRKIIISVNGEKAAETETNDEGKFSFRNIKLSEGDNKISVVAMYREDKSVPTEFTVLFKKEPPNLEISEPTDGATIRIEAKTVIKGFTDADASITVNDHRVILDREGNFNYPVTLSEGENIYKIQASDSAGNTTIKELKINFAP